MSDRHLTPRSMRTRGEKSITWARVAPPPGIADGITYRLARRDLNNRLYFEVRTFFSGTPRGRIAESIWAARRRLRDTVDAQDMIILGLAEGVAA